LSIFLYARRNAFSGLINFIAKAFPYLILHNYDNSPVAC